MLPHHEPPATLVDLLRQRAGSTPDRCAFTFLIDGEAQEESLTYGELDQRARGVARLLRERGVDGPCVLAYPAGLDFLVGFFGCLYAGVPAVPAHAPRVRDRRLQSIITDCQPVAALSTSDVVTRMGGELPWIATNCELPPADESELPEVGPNTIALLQYTSGSIGTPKGVVLDHANLLANTRTIRDLIDLKEDSVFVSWLPLFHDMGMGAGVLQPLFAGARSVLFSPSAFAQRPARWVEIISRYKATHSGGPNFAYALCGQRASAEGIDLSSWKVAFCGGEPVRSGSIERFADTFAASGFDARAFWPCYGLAEATLLVSGGPRFVGLSSLRVDAVRSLARCGEIAPDQTVAIVDPDTFRRCADGEEGEIWVAGPNVGRGYWNRPDESRETFGARTIDGEGPFLRTGDLGFVRDNCIYVAGRLKDMIIVRGRNYYANDVEASVDGSHDSLIPAAAAAFSVAGRDRENVVVVQEIATPIEGDIAPVISAIRRAVFADHDLSVGVVLVRRGAVPRTTSGKVQRRRCRQLLLNSELRVVAESLI